MPDITDLEGFRNPRRLTDEAVFETEETLTFWSGDDPLFTDAELERYVPPEVIPHLLVAREMFERPGSDPGEVRDYLWRLDKVLCDSGDELLNCFVLNLERRIYKVAPLRVASRERHYPVPGSEVMTADGEPVTDFSELEGYRHPRGGMPAGIDDILTAPDWDGRAQLFPDVAIEDFVPPELEDYFVLVRGIAARDPAWAFVIARRLSDRLSRCGDEPLLMFLLYLKCRLITWLDRRPRGGAAGAVSANRGVPGGGGGRPRLGGVGGLQGGELAVLLGEFAEELGAALDSARESLGRALARVGGGAVAELRGGLPAPVFFVHLPRGDAGLARKLSGALPPEHRVLGGGGGPWLGFAAAPRTASPAGTGARAAPPGGFVPIPPSVLDAWFEGRSAVRGGELELGGLRAVVLLECCRHLARGWRSPAMADLSAHLLAFAATRALLDTGTLDAVRGFVSLFCPWDLGSAAEMAGLALGPGKGDPPRPASALARDVLYPRLADLLVAGTTDTLAPFAPVVAPGDLASKREQVSRELEFRVLDPAPVPGSPSPWGALCDVVAGYLGGASRERLQLNAATWTEYLEVVDLRAHLSRDWPPGATGGPLAGLEARIARHHAGVPGGGASRELRAAWERASSGNWGDG
ncbi:MAG: hypothetical protein ACTSU5_14745 [Promethearchaeota archaeon]